MGFPFMPIVHCATKKPSIVFTDNYGDGTDSTNYTATSRAIGTAAANRFVVVGVGLAGNGALRTISSLTIGGVSASQIVDQTSGNRRIALWGATVPTGTTGNIVVNTSGGNFYVALGIWALYDLNSTTATATSSSTSDPATLDLNISADGVGCAMAFDITTSSPSNWTGASEDFDANLDGSTDYTGAHFSSTTAQTPYALSVDNTGSAANHYRVAATFR